jgi:elongation factor Ts
MDGVKVSESTKALIAKIGENINLRRFEKLANKENYVTSYVHGNGKIGVIVGLKASKISTLRDSQDLKNIGKNVALQVAAMKPQFLDESSVPETVVAAESEVIKNKFLKQGKPEQALLKIIPGSIKKWMKEICLNAQDYVKDEGNSIKSYVQASGKALGLEDLEISEFKYLELGQGVEKKSENFADEVAAQVASAQK